MLRVRASEMEKVLTEDDCVDSGAETGGWVKEKQQMQNISLNVWDFGIRKYFKLTTANVHSHFHLRRSEKAHNIFILFYFKWDLAYWSRRSSVKFTCLFILFFKCYILHLLLRQTKLGTSCFWDANIFSGILKKDLTQSCLAGKRVKLTLFTPLQPLNKDVPRCLLRYVTDLMLCCCKGFTSCFPCVFVSLYVSQN